MGWFVDGCIAELPVWRRVVIVHDKEYDTINQCNHNGDAMEKWLELGFDIPVLLNAFQGG